MKYFNYGTSIIDKVLHFASSGDWRRKARLRWPWLFSLNGAPVSVGIEVTNACNLRCIMCHREVMTREIGFMDFDLFKECARQGIEMGVKMIVPFNYGESLLHPKLVDMVEYVKALSKDTLVKINTNGMLMTREYAKALVHAGIDEITFSLEGCTKKSHEEIAIGSKYERVLANLMNLIDLKKGEEKPQVRVCMVRMEETASALKQFTREWQPLVDAITIHDVNTGYGTLKDRRVEKRPLERRVPCRELWLKLQVLWNGDVTVCCIDYDGKLKIGEIPNNSLNELWVGSQLQGMRAIHRARQFERIPICSKCDSDNHL